MKLHAITLGCQMSAADGAETLARLRARGWDEARSPEEADAIFLTTCSVRGHAEQRALSLIGRLREWKAKDPERFLVVAGCVAERLGESLAKRFPHIDLVVGSKKAGSYADLVEQAVAVKNSESPQAIRNCLSAAPQALPKPSAPPRGADVPLGDNAVVQSLTIMRGCSCACSYCIVPYTRGRSRSLAPDQVLAQAEIFAEQGYKEQVLTGIHLGHYGHDLAPRTNLRELLARLLARNLPVRYRLSSLEPTEITGELLTLMAESPAVMPYLHIPLQSGDDRILKRMNRRYPVATFAKVVADSVVRLPEMAIGVDVLVGFPGEDEEAFRHTYDLLASLPVSYLHIFPYSKRPGTPAAEMADQVPKAVKEERVALLRDLHHKKRTAFYQSHLGSTRQILVERRKKECLLRGYSENYIPVSFAGESALVNQLVTVRLEELAGDGVLGRIV